VTPTKREEFDIGVCAQASVVCHCGKPYKMKNFFENSILKLQKERGIFHSEDDLKLSLGFIIKELYSEFEIRLEKPTNIDMINIDGNESIVRAPIDIIVYDKNGKSIPIELKYKTKKLETEFNGESYEHTTPQIIL